MFRLAPLALPLALTACGPNTRLFAPDAILPDGSRYHGTGQWQSTDGQGTLSKADGSRYSGGFRQGRSAAKTCWRKPATLSRQSAAGRSHGFGILQQADGFERPEPQIWAPAAVLGHRDAPRQAYSEAP